MYQVYAYGSAECVEVVNHSSSTLWIPCNANIRKLHDAPKRDFSSAISQTDLRQERSRAGSRRFRSRRCRRTWCRAIRRPGCWPRASERNVRWQNTRFMYPAAARGIQTLGRGSFYRVHLAEVGTIPTRVSQANILRSMSETISLCGDRVVGLLARRNPLPY